MKKILILLAMILATTYAEAQSRGSSSNSAENAMGLTNGCNDARSAEPNAAYQSIMNNGSISSTYKQAYQLGWSRCRNNSSWQVVNGVLVNQSKAKINTTKSKTSETIYEVLIVFTGGNSK